MLHTNLCTTINCPQHILHFYRGKSIQTQTYVSSPALSRDIYPPRDLCKNQQMKYTHKRLRNKKAQKIEKRKTEAPVEATNKQNKTGRHGKSVAFVRKWMSELFILLEELKVSTWLMLSILNSAISLLLFAASGGGSGSGGGGIVSLEWAPWKMTCSKCCCRYFL